MLCPGAEPIRPPIPCAADERVDVLRDIADMDRIIARVEKGATRAVVVGGSYIGLELTEAFKTRGLQTTVAEHSERLMPWLDPEMTRILDYHVDANGGDLRLGTSATAVRRSESNGLVLDLDDGASVEADIVVFAAGVRPSVQLAREAGIELGPHGGIKVDAHMRTFAPDILAAGDAVETPNFLTGEPGLSMLAGPANWESRIAAETIVGRNSAYRGTQGAGIVKVFDMAAGGLTISNGPAFDESHGRLYLADTALFVVDVFDLDPTAGELSDRRRFLDLTEARFWPDGMTVEDEDMFWVALGLAGTVHRYRPDGTLDGIVELPTSNPHVGGLRRRRWRRPLHHDLLGLTTSWVDCEQRATQPRAGAIFRCRSGVTSRPTPRFAALPAASAAT